MPVLSSMKCSTEFTKARISSSALLLRPPLVPLPCRGDDVIELGNVRSPLQLACCTHGIADQSSGVPRSPFAQPHRDGEAGNTLDRRDHFANRIAVTIPQVERAVREALLQGLQCQDVGLR